MRWASCCCIFLSPWLCTAPYLKFRLSWLPFSWQCHFIVTHTPHPWVIRSLSFQQSIKEGKTDPGIDISNDKMLQKKKLIESEENNKKKRALLPVVFRKSVLSPCEISVLVSLETILANIQGVLIPLVFIAHPSPLRHFAGKFCNRILQSYCNSCAMSSWNDRASRKALPSDACCSVNLSRRIDDAVRASWSWSWRDVTFAEASSFSLLRTCGKSQGWVWELTYVRTRLVVEFVWIRPPAVFCFYGSMDFLIVCWPALTHSHLLQFPFGCFYTIETWKKLRKCIVTLNAKNLRISRVQINLNKKFLSKGVYTVDGVSSNPGCKECG